MSPTIRAPENARDDLVARCGMLAPHKEGGGIYLAGANYVRQGKWGHLLSVHYLKGMKKHLDDPSKEVNPYRLDAEGRGSADLGRPRLYGNAAGPAQEAF
ncbi:MAG: hypothetical protein AAGN66_11470 [Acidobacteriota bacterium]